MKSEDMKSEDMKKKNISLITTYRLYEKSHQLEWFDDLDWKVEWWPDLSPGSSPWWSVALSDHAEDHGGWPHRPKSAPPEWLPADQYWGSMTKKKKSQYIVHAVPLWEKYKTWSTFFLWILPLPPTAAFLLGKNFSNFVKWPTYTLTVKFMIDLVWHTWKYHLQIL